MKKGILLIGIALLTLLVITASAKAWYVNDGHDSGDTEYCKYGNGDVIIPINSTLSDLVADPIRPYFYVSDSGNNAVLMISTENNTVEKSIWVGSNPKDMDISSDGSALYVALSGASDIAVVDLETQTKTDTIPLSFTPHSLATGKKGRLYVGMGSETKIINTTNKTIVGSLSGGGVLEITSDRNTLYTWDYGHSYPNIYKWNVTTDIPVLNRSGHVIGGGCGLFVQMKLSPDDSQAYFTSGSSDDGIIPVFDTTSFTLEGQLQLEWTPIAIALSPDGSKVYAVHKCSVTNPTYPTSERHDCNRKDIHVFNTATFLEENFILVADFVSEKGLEITPDGSKLFAIIGSSGDQSIQVITLVSEESQTHGDLNGDNVITPADAAIALQIAASGAYNPAADVSGDGLVTSLDALMILQAAAGATSL